MVTQYLLHRIEVVLRKNYNVRTWLCMSLTCAYASLSLLDIYCPQTKLREGNVFTGMCLFTNGERGRYDWSQVPSWSLVQCAWGGGVRISLVPCPFQGVWYLRSHVPSGGKVWGRGRVYPQETLFPGTTKAGGTHPTGMLSC